MLHSFRNAMRFAQHPLWGEELAKTPDPPALPHAKGPAAMNRKHATRAALTVIAAAVSGAVRAVVSWLLPD